MKKNYLFWVTFCVTTISFGQGFETFTNSPLGASYATGNFIGDNGVTWNYVECRDEKGDEYNSGITIPGIMLRNEGNGSLISIMSGVNGVGDISMKLYRGFSSSTNRQVDVYVNGVLYGTSPGFNDTTEHSYKITGINEVGDVLIEIKNTKSVQIIIDDVKWSEFGTTLSIVKNQIEGFSMYPNPVSNGKLFMNSNSNFDKQLEIYSMLGKRVYRKNVNTKETIDISKLNAGIYMVKIKEEEKISTRKLIIK